LRKIKLFDPVIDHHEEETIQKVLKSKKWASGSGIGFVEKFEKGFKKYVDAKECVAVNSGTSALNLAMSTIDIKNKEVIVPSFTFVSTIHSIVINGGKPVFADIDPDTLCIDHKKIDKLISKKTKACLVVHFGGMSCNLKELKNITKKNELVLVEDSAHAVGTKFQNKKIGAHSDLVCFSFHPVKNLAMPNGGLISINHKNHKKIREELLAKRWCGITNRKGVNYDVKELGWNYYMNDFSAAIGLEQLKKIDKLNLIRKKIANRYNNEINIKEKMPFSNDCSYHLYWILVKNRDSFRKKMTESNIETGIHYRPAHTLSMYKTKKKLPITETVGNSIVTIPIHPNLSEKDVKRIVFCINKFTK
jgi:perosamine synthetase